MKRQYSRRVKRKSRNCSKYRNKYFACGSLVCMGMAIYSGHKIAPKKKKAEKPEK
ncbi:MAG: DUF6219 family protein [Lachnospiraceae bacterium]